MSISNVVIKSAMHLKSEPGDYHLLRPEGQNAFNFVHFLYPIIIRSDGVEEKTKNDACIIYSPHARQEYHALPEGFTNDFVTFYSDDPLFVSRFGLPENRVFYVEDGKSVTALVEYIAWALIDFQENHQQDLVSHLHLLLRTLSASLISESPRDQRYYLTRKRFTELRGQMRSSPKDWSVDKMAQAVYLTRSRFSFLYREFFQTSPNADLMGFTIDFAKQRLADSKRPIAAIAQDCGYGSVEHFIRLFKKMEGMTPGQYRKIQDERRKHEST